MSVVRDDIREYGERHPGPADVGLVVEVADQSLDVDRDLKARIYARAGVPTYWIVNLVDRTIEVYAAPRSSPEPATYTLAGRFAADGNVPFRLDGHDFGRVAVAHVLPPLPSSRV